MKSFLVLSILLLCYQVQAQQFSNVIIANGGQFEQVAPYNDRATIGAYSPANGQYWVFDTIMVESVQGVVVDGNYAYLAATDSIIKYDLTTYKRVGQAYFAGIRSITIIDTLLFAGRFYDYSGTLSFLEVFDKNTLTSLFSVPEIDQIVYSVQVIGDSAYVPYNQKGLIDQSPQFPQFGEYLDTIGKIAVIDLVNQVFVRDILLDTMGAGAKAIYNYNDQLYTVCDVNGVIAHYDPINNTTTYDIAGVSGGFAQVDSLIYLNTGFGVVGTYDVKNMQIVNNALVSTGSTVASALDTLNDEFYFNTTDYGSFGKSFIYDFTGNLADSFDINVSPQAMDVDYKTGNYGPIAINDYIETASIEYIKVLDNDFDPNGDALIIEILTAPNSGTAAVENDSILFTTTVVEIIIWDSLQYKVCDGSLCDSAWVKIYIDGGAGVSENKVNQISIYPNPTSGIVKIEGVESGIYSVVDINGRLILNGNLTANSSVDITDKPSGVYFIQLVNNNNTSTNKLIKF
ncbi:MAG: T9SS type A sorting domain-containing protein [Flavobacteriales bacterium]|nr:T9SS type A sorting domain-containing protein [Flavobacteriales bacterium]